MSGPKLIIISINLIISLVLTNIAFAENKTFIKEYTYTASDIDSKVSSRAIALEQVKRALLEQLGTYLMSETEVKNYQMTKDQVMTLTAGIVSAEIVDEMWDGKTYYLKAKIAADPSEVAKSVNSLKNDVKKSKELSDLRYKAEEAMREVERLKKELVVTKANINKQDDYSKAIKSLSAADWFAKGNALYEREKYKAAIDAFDKAIELDPKYADAFQTRGFANYLLGNIPQAIGDYNKAIELAPLQSAYFLRGMAYVYLGNIPQAIKDYSKDIELNPDCSFTYQIRGEAYAASGDSKLAFDDFNTSIKLDPRNPSAYFSRANTNSKLGKHAQAIKDYNMAIELKPQFAEAYYNRGIAYDQLNLSDIAKANYKIAARLGFKQAQEFLNSNGITW